MVTLPEHFRGYVCAILQARDAAPPAASEEEWETVLKALLPHGILPLLYWRITRLPEPSRPPLPVVHRLRSAYLWSVQQSLKTEAQLRRVLDALAGAGAEALVLKGQALAWTHYERPACRPASDIDLLVRPRDFERARAVMRDLGFQRQLTTFAEVFRDIYNEENYSRCDERHAADGHYVELHWDLTPFAPLQRPPTVEGIFARTVEVKAGGAVIRAMEPADALLHAALHMMKHRENNRLIWVHDIALLARGLDAPSDRRIVQERAREWRARGALVEALTLARQWFDILTPAWLDDPGEWPPLSEEEQEACRDLSDHRTRSQIRRYLGVLRRRGATGIPTLARFWFRVFIPPPDAVRGSYPSSHAWLLPFSYVRRWLHWLMHP